MNVIQSGTAQLLSTPGQPFTVKFTDAKVVIIQARLHDVWVAFSQGNLDNPNARFKVHKDSSPDPNNLVLPFAVPCSGTLFFASANAADVATVSVMCMSGEYGY
tara:strand:+ start:10618 stop:10929 length:312 start_codon:yes stop_codon:yes gene_type:complete